MEKGWKEQAERLAELLRLMVRPVGVKLVAKEEEADIKALRPGRDFGRKFTFCQALSIAGRMGIPVMVSGQDEGCIVVLAIYGMGVFEPASKIPESQCAMGWVKDMDTAMRFIGHQAEDVIPPGTYAGFLASPLEFMEERPDVIMVYASPCQVVRMVQGYGYVTGECIESAFHGFAGTCVSGVLRTRRLNKPQVVLPGYGDRSIARVEDHEMAFSFTLDHMEALLEGIPDV
jgi:uncharacterized protein (DUF169 family)